MKMKRDDFKEQVVLYKNRLEVRLDKETVWLTQKQMAVTFPPKTAPADKLVFGYNEILLKEEICPEEKVYRRADCFCFESGRTRNTGVRSDPQDGYFAAENLG